MLDPRIHDEIINIHQKELPSLPTREQLQFYAETFRKKFGPEHLSRLHGRELLESMHSHGNKDSLVYWLEFKKDDEFPGIFGSIAGGSALKFGIYKSAETGEWKGGHPRKIITLSEDEAINRAERHRDCQR